MPRDQPTTLTLDRYSPEARGLVAGAQALADERRHAEVTPLHLLARALDREPAVVEVLRRSGAAVGELPAAVERALGTQARSTEPSWLSGATIDLLERAERDAARERAPEVGVAQLLNALSQEIRGAAGELLAAAGVTPGSLRGHMAPLTQSRSGAGKGAPASGQRAATRDLVDEARRGIADPVLCRDAEVRRVLTILERRAKQHPLLVGEHGVGKGAVVRALALRVARGDVPAPLIGVRLLELDAGVLAAGARLRGEIEERVRQLLAEVSGADTILVARGIEQLFGQGPAGSGVGDLLRPALSRGEVRLIATTTPEGLRRISDRDPALPLLFSVVPVAEPGVEPAIEIVRGLASRFELHHDLVVTEGAIVAAVRLARRYVRERALPDSALDLLDEAAAARRVEVDGVPWVVDGTRSRVAALELQVQTLAGATDPTSVAARDRLGAELERLRPEAREQQAALESRRGAAAALRALRRELAEAEGALERAREGRELARQGELEHVALPDLRQRVGRAEEALRAFGGEVDRSLDEHAVAATLEVWTGIPVARMLEGEAEKLLGMEARLEERVVGQADAVSAVSRAVRRSRVGLRDPGKPIGSFLFLGPSGVGKTELAKALAEYLFDDEQAMTRLDMSEFMERHMAQRLIGAPPGYADSEQGGFLTEAVRRRPYSVLLFDEVEKAHQDVWNLLLQVLDDGRLTDGRGRPADFSNTVVILTSNLGSDRILVAGTDALATDGGRDALRDVLLEELRGFFRPEFLNRIDEVVVFQPLGRSELARIADIQLRRLGRQLAERRLELALSPEARERLLDLGYEPALGARPLRRAILRHVQDPLATAVLAGRLPDGARVEVRLVGDEFVLAESS
ncbi:MAG: AAA family ATPase [Polyangiaceae bacterium]|nr:AAA family ATPase [Polyangiaceae bacterium]